LAKQTYGHHQTIAWVALSALCTGTVGFLAGGAASASALRHGSSTTTFQII